MAGQRGQWGTTPVPLCVPGSPSQASATWSGEGRLLAQQRPLPTKRENCSTPELLYVSFLKTVYLFIYFIYLQLWVFVALRSLSLVEASGNYSLLWGTGLLTAVTPLVAEPSCRHEL